MAIVMLCCWTAQPSADISASIGGRRFGSCFGEQDADAPWGGEICDPPDTVRRHRVGRRISPSALSRQMHHATRSGSKSEAMLGELWYEVDKKMI